MPTSPEAPVAATGEQQADGELLRRVVAGEQAAARQVVGQHLPSITRFAFRMLGDATDAQDVAQESFLRLWRAAERWEPRAKLSTWLHRVAHNLCVDRLRTRREVPLDAAPEGSDPEEEPARQLERHQMVRSVVEALDALPERQRAALALVYYEGMSNLQAAEVMGVHVDAIESLLARGRRKLRQKLAGNALENRKG
jgi:RNA polymerase sigma-70 factor (ECF subfamily)